jgi:hypothetical protein
MTRKAIDPNDLTVYITIGTLALPARIAEKLEADSIKQGRSACVRNALIEHYESPDAEEF